jgi:hypothetical protein
MVSLPILKPLLLKYSHSSEPGYYEDGKFGIRIESKFSMRSASDAGIWLHLLTDLRRHYHGP